MATYYVRSGGSNGAAGTTGAPWATIAFGLSQLAPGDTLLVGDGTWGAFTVSQSGSAGLPITIKAENQHGAFIDVNEYAGIIVTGNYTVIDGFRIRNYSRHGIEYQYCHHLTIKNCLVEDCGGNGIGGLRCDHMIVEDNTCRRNGRTGWNSGISFYNPNHRASGDESTVGTSRNIFRRNVVYENHMLAFVNFDTGGAGGTAAIVQGDLVEIGANTSSGIADRIEVTSGSWAAGTAAGRIGIKLRGIASTPADNAVITVGGQTRALVAGTGGYYTDNGLFTDGNGIILDDWSWAQNSVWDLAFRNGTTAIAAGAVITVGADPTGLTVDSVYLLSGSWGAGTAAGFIRTTGTAGTPADGAAIAVSGATRALVSGGAGFVPYFYAYGALVEDNVVYGNGGKGIQFYGVAYTGTSPAGTEEGIARNNTLWHNNQDMSMSGSMTWRGDLSAQDSPYCTFENNIVVCLSNDSNVGAIGAYTGGATYDVECNNNITFGSRSRVEGAAIVGSGNLWETDPYLTDPENGDFRPASNSPAINAGTDGETIGAITELGPEFVPPTYLINPAGISSITYGARTNTTVPAPAEPIEDGSLILLAMFTYASGGAVPARTPPAGFTAVTSASVSLSDPSNNNAVLQVWKKTASGESGNYTVTHSSASSAAGIVVLTGANVSAAIGVTTNQGTQNTSSFTGQTVGFEDGYVVAVGADWGDQSNDLSPPSGLAEFIEHPTFYVAGGQIDGTSVPTRTQTNNNLSYATWSQWGTIVLTIEPEPDTSNDGAESTTLASVTGAATATLATASAGGATLASVTTASTATLALVAAASATLANVTGSATISDEEETEVADISITAANVVASAAATKESGIAGATITAGQVVYKDPADNKYKLADGDNATAVIRKPVGIALNGASNGQPLAIVKSGDVTIGATLTAGAVYILGDDAGGISPIADGASGDDVVIIGVAISTSVLRVGIVITGVTL